MHRRNCNECGKAYTAKQKNSRFCSKKCNRRRYGREKYRNNPAHRERAKAFHRAKYWQDRGDLERAEAERRKARVVTLRMNAEKARKDPGDSWVAKKLAEMRGEA